MATYHALHTFVAKLSPVYSTITRKNEMRPGHFCEVCGRPENHILHTGGHRA